MDGSCARSEPSAVLWFDTGGSRHVGAGKPSHAGRRLSARRCYRDGTRGLDSSSYERQRRQGVHSPFDRLPWPARMAATVFRENTEAEARRFVWSSSQPEGTRGSRRSRRPGARHGSGDADLAKRKGHRVESGGLSSRRRRSGSTRGGTPRAIRTTTCTWLPPRNGRSSRTRDGGRNLRELRSSRRVSRRAVTIAWATRQTQAMRRSVGPRGMP
jgi:hypothetical protein